MHEPGRDGGQPRLRGLDGVLGRVPAAAKALLDDVLRLAEAADHAVGDRQHQRPQIFVCHSRRPCFVCTDMNTLRIFLAGASGTLGRRLVPQLVGRGHHVVGTTRSTARAAESAALGAEPAVARPARRRAPCATPSCRRGRTSSCTSSPRSPASAWAATSTACSPTTNRLRTEGTDHLIAAARAAGARRLVWQSYAGWPYARQGGPVKTEDDPLDPEPPADARESLAAIRHLEAAVMGADGLEGVVLRYGGFYGPDDVDRRGRRARRADPQAPVPDRGRRRGHVVVRAHRRRRGRHGRGDRARRARHLQRRRRRRRPPRTTGCRRLRPPSARSRRGALPAWLVRLAGGRTGADDDDPLRAASNAKAERELGWRPQHSWRELQYGGKSAYQSPSTRNDFQNARLDSSSSSASSMLDV